MCVAPDLGWKNNNYKTN